MVDKPSTDHLVGGMKDVALLVSLRVAEILVEHFAGARLYIPKNPKKHHRLWSAGLKTEQIDLLVKYFGNGELDIPVNLYNPDTSRAERVLNKRAKKYTVTDIAISERMPERSVYRVLARAKKQRDQHTTDKKQTFLF